MKTLKASLIASTIGTGAWTMGLTRLMWPAHPQLAAFVLTLVLTFVFIDCLSVPLKEVNYGSKSNRGNQIEVHAHE